MAPRTHDDGQLDMLLADWDLWMTAAGNSVRTRTERIRCVNLMARRTGADPLTCDWRPLATFLAPYRDRPGTQGTYQGHLRAFYRWLLQQELRGDDPTVKLPRVHVPRRLPRPIPDDQLAAVLSTRMHHRTRVMVLLALCQGMRDSEIARHRGEFIRSGKIRILGKGDTDELIPLAPEVAAIADTMPDIGWWFPSNSTRPGKHVTGHSVSKIIGDVMRRAGVPTVPHQLRHTYGTNLLRDAGGNVRIAQQGLRHRHIASTAIYTLVEDDELAAAIAKQRIPLHVRR